MGWGRVYYIRGLYIFISQIFPLLGLYCGPVVGRRGEIEAGGVSR